VKVEKCGLGARIADIRGREQRFLRGRQDAEVEILRVAKGVIVRMTELVAYSGALLVGRGKTGAWAADNPKRDFSLRRLRSE
jgi:hypothetical protein